MAAVLGSCGRVADHLVGMVKDHRKTVLTVVAATVVGVATVAFHPTLRRGAAEKASQLAQKNPMLFGAGLALVAVAIAAILTIGILFIGALFFVDSIGRC